MDAGYGLVHARTDPAARRHQGLSMLAVGNATGDETRKRFGRLDCILNNAGDAGAGGGIEEIPVEGSDETMGVLVRGVFLGIKHAARVMKKQGSGSIISTASVAGLSPDRADEVIPLMKGVLENFQPIKRPGLPDDIARAALWLASDEAGFVNGHALVVDGGLIGGRLWSEVQQRHEVFRATPGLT